MPNQPGPSSPTNLNELFGRSKPASVKRQPIRPSAALAVLDSERNKREFAHHDTLTLLGLEDELSSRERWLKETNQPTSDKLLIDLDQIRRELRQYQRMVDIKSGTVGFEWKRRNKWLSMYPDEGPLRRELYFKAMEFYRQGATFNERLLLGANRAGKTLTAAYEIVCHATGIYPPWWEGKRFYEPLTLWIANKGAKEVRDINEQELLGPAGNLALRGSGMLPGHRIVKCTPKSGTPNGIEFIDVRHVSGGISRIQSKSFDQGREAFQGTAIHVIWPDEECPEDVYGEMVLRIMTVNGIILMTYTPIKGLTQLTTDFLNEAGIPISGESIPNLEPVAKAS